ncbi:MAG: hypothetical protein ABI318_21980 [Chthoniobacteraceae bacterium]
MSFLVYIGVQISVRRGKERKALDDFNEIRRDMAAQMQREVDKDGGVSADTSAKVTENIRQHFDRIAAAGGDKTTIAVSEVLAELQSRTAPYVAIQKRFETEAPFDMSNVKDKTDLIVRRTLGQELLRVNSDYLALINSMESRLREKLLQIGAPNPDGFVAGFMKTFNESAAIHRRLRKTEETHARSLIAMTDLLEAQWGQWKALNGTINFDDANMTTRYNDLLNAVTKAAEEQVTAERELIHRQQQK